MRMFSASLNFLLIIALIGTGDGGRQTPVPATSAPAVAGATSKQQEVHVLVQLVDRMGNPLPTPSKEQLHVNFGGQPVEIVEIRPLKEQPLFFSLIVDLSGSTREYEEHQASVAISLFAALAAGGNHGYLVRFSETIDASTQALSPEEAENELRGIHRWGSSALYDAIIAACTRQLRSDALPRDARRAVFVISDGEENSSNHSFKEAVQAAQKEGIPIFPVVFSMAPETKQGKKRGYNILREFSTRTGGLLTQPGEHGENIGNYPGFLRGQSSLTFRTGELKPMQKQTLKIETNDKNVQVLVQREYIAP